MVLRVTRAFFRRVRPGHSDVEGEVGRGSAVQKGGTRPTSGRRDQVDNDSDLVFSPLTLRKESEVPGYPRLSVMCQIAGVDATIGFRRWGRGLGSQLCVRITTRPVDGLGTADAAASATCAGPRRWDDAFADTGGSRKQHARDRLNRPARTHPPP